jgi:glycosyltransferase involved in cell wall biosynthesis
MERNNPKVSIIIPTKNRCQSLKECLDSFLRQAYKNFEVVIVDGGSTDGTKQLVAHYKNKIDIIFIEQKRKGLVNAVNEGWKSSYGEIIIRTDDDIVASQEWLREVIEIFGNLDGVGGVTGPTIIPEALKENRDIFFFQRRMREGNLFWRLLGRVYFDYFLEGETLAIGKFFRSGAFSVGSNYVLCLKLKTPMEVDHHEACNMAIKRTLLEKIDGFDEIFVGIGDFSEPDVSFKIRKLGYRIIFNPKAVVYHLPSREGFFKERPSSRGRITNFINFYFRHIKPNTPDKFFRFFSYILFLNCFYIYKAITTRQINQFGGIFGTVVGLTKNIFRI